jgi:hypothetical protein
MAMQGAVADRIQALIPITWDALSSDPRVGDGALQTSIDLAKQNTVGMIVDPSQEDRYPVVVVDYMAKLAIIQICNAAIDYWMNQANNVSSSGTAESISYTDRASRIAVLQAQYLVETRSLAAEVAKLVGYWIDPGHDVPQLSTATINPFHLTPSPEEFPRPFRQTPYS